MRDKSPDTGTPELRGSAAPAASMPVWWMPAIVSAVSVVAVNLAYLISVSTGQVAICIPYLEGCSSISRAARHAPAIHLFRATMIPIAAVIAAVWWLAGQWLFRAGDENAAIRRVMVAIGLVGALSLVLYGTFLGTHGPAYDLMRRYGVTVFFAFTALSELIVTARLERLRRSGRAVIGANAERAMLALAAAMLILGLADIPVSHLLDADGLENAIEWDFALLMMVWFAVLAATWRRAGLTVSVTGTGRR